MSLVADQVSFRDIYSGVDLSFFNLVWFLYFLFFLLVKTFICYITMSRINVILICSFFKKDSLFIITIWNFVEINPHTKVKAGHMQSPRPAKLFSTAPRHQLIPNFKNSTNKLRRMVEVKLKSCPVRRRIYACCILFNRPDLFEAFGI